MGKVAWRTGLRTAALSVLLGVALAAAAAQAQAVAIRELQLGLVGTGSPNHITAGAEGNLWFTGHNEASIDRITPEGALTEFFVTPNSSPEGITVGPNGKLWFTEPGWDRIGRLSSAGALTEFASDGITSQTAGIVLGPEGNLWFTQNDGAVGRITTAGSVTEFSAGISQSAAGIALGPDGNLWFTEQSKIGRITPDGVVTEFSERISPGSEPRGIALGPDGNLWFTERGTGGIGRITPAGVVTEFHEGITPGSEPLEIAAGPDGNLWFTERAGDRIGRITTAGLVTEFSAGISPGSAPSGITAGPDDSMWFTEEAGGRIGQVTLSAAAPPTAVTGAASSVTPTSATLNATVNPNGSSDSDCHFEYGSSEFYGSRVPCTALPGAGSSAVAVVASVANLSESTTYHVRIVTTNAGGTSYGADQTFTTKAQLPPPQPPAGMWVGVNAGNWGPQQYADVKGAVNAVRADSCSSNTEFRGWDTVGITVIDDISGDGVCGPYRTGVRAINIAAWVAEAVAQVKANRTISAVEILNEPGGQWFWGPEAESTANEAAYASLVKAVHEAFVAEFGSARPLILASYDGGHSQEVSWGEGVWNEATNGGINVDEYVDGITMHPYNWPTTGSTGARSNVARAHAKTGKPVYITELGWNTAQVTEAEQAANIYDFVSWARSTGYVADVTIFEYRDYTSNPDENAWGIETWGGEKKPAYTALKEATAGLPLSLE
jgi:streptogramin lyase